MKCGALRMPRVVPNCNGFRPGMTHRLPYKFLQLTQRALDAEP